MMVHESPHFPPEKADTPYTLITGLAATASDRTLALLLVAATVCGTGLLIVDASFWPLSALAGTLGTIAAWGLLAHRAARHPSGLLTGAQRLLVLVGSVLALIAALAIFFGLLGPRWML